MRLLRASELRSSPEVRGPIGHAAASLGSEYRRRDPLRPSTLRMKTVLHDPELWVFLGRGRRRPATSRGAGGRCKGTERPEGLKYHIVTIFATETPQGRLGGARGGFSLRFLPSRRRPRTFTSLSSHAHRMWGSIGGRGTAAHRGRMGGSRFTITKGVC
jgi:hypothetical protein